MISASSLHVMVATLGFALLGGCSVVVKQDFKQCRTDLDCSQYPGMRCDEGGGCVPRNATDAAVSFEPVTKCTATEECLADRGPGWICAPKSRVCEKLTSADCTDIIGDYKRDSVTLIGAMLPLGKSQQPLGKSVFSSLQLAVDEMLSGLPPLAGTARRPLAVVVCNESDDAKRAFTHLQSNVKVPLIIGPVLQSSLSKVAQAAIDQKLPLLLPSALNQPTGIAPSDYLIRFSTSMPQVGKAITSFVTTILEPKVKIDLRFPETVVAVMHKSDELNSALEKYYETNAVVNGSAFLSTENATRRLVAAYGNPDDPQGQDSQKAITDAVQKVVSMAKLPNVIVLLGDSEVTASVIPAIETAWPKAGNPTKPFYVVLGSAVVGAMANTLKTDESLRTRLAMLFVGADAGKFAATRAYIQRLAVQHPTQTFATLGASQSYDSAYLSAFAIAQQGTSELKGESLAASLVSILSSTGTKTDLGPTTYSANLTSAVQKKPFDVEGASGPMFYDATSKATKADVHFLCGVQDKATGNVTLEASGVYLPFDGSLQGILIPNCLAAKI